MVKILLIDDEQEWLDSMRRTLSSNYITSFASISLATNKADGLAILSSKRIDMVFLDLMLSDEHGEDILQEIKASYPELPVFIMTGVNSLSSAVNCIKLGASDYFVKTMNISELVASIRRFIHLIELERENRELKHEILSNEITNLDAFDSFITRSEVMYDIFKYLSVVAKSSQPILITGESGVGKGVLAKAISTLSRPNEPFISVNVAGLDSEMFMDSIVGHVKGAFTSAYNSRSGAIDKAGSGTLFIDEIGDLSLSSQVKLLDIVQDKRYQPLGSDQIRNFNARLIFATNIDLKKHVDEGKFRRDLYYRLNTHMVCIPPLRERTSDIELLANHFLGEARSEFSKPNFEISQKTLQALKSLQYEGNVRQLRSIVLDIVARGDEYDFINDNKALNENITQSDTLATYNLEEINNQIIKKVLKMTNGNQLKAAAMLGISQSTLSRKIKAGKIDIYN